MNKLIALFTLMSAICGTGVAQQKQLAKPSAVQYKWQEQDRIMFIHFGVASWLGMENDETGKFDLSRMNPTELNTDDWCKTALSWGAKEIIFVAKHVGWVAFAGGLRIQRNTAYEIFHGKMAREICLPTWQHPAKNTALTWAYTFTPAM